MSDRIDSRSSEGRSIEAKLRPDFSPDDSAGSTAGAILAGHVRNIAQLMKLRLSSIVVFSAAIGFVLGSAQAPFFSWTGFVFLLLGGTLVTGASNAINQILEKDTDSLMTRTADRPLPTGRMTMAEAVLTAGLASFGGVIILWTFFGALTALVGALALISYAFIYTPIKRISPIAVFIGAFPGALPPLIGWTAATGSLGPEALALFGIQFFWQFPHFWAIAWLQRDDYARAGFDLMPSASGRSRASAIHVVVYAAVLLPIGLLPFFLGMGGLISAIVITLCGALFLGQAIRLYRECSMDAARKLMFGSFAYLPAVLIALAIASLSA
jgi:protoheme IX farnesyltransferase